MLRGEGIVVSNYTAGFWPEFISGGGELSNVCEFGSALHDVEDVGVVIKGVESMRIGLCKGIKNRLGLFKVASMVMEKSSLCLEPRGAREEVQEVSKLLVDWIGGLVEFLISAQYKQVSHNVVGEFMKDQV